MQTSRRMALAASALSGAARVALGLLWAHEGLVKIHANFGVADILLVVGGASSNSRVPEYFRLVSEHLLRPTASLAGLAVPFVEIGLGLLLVAGLLTVRAAAVSSVLLAIYWASDQLIAQYPVMAVLAVITIWGRDYVDRWSLPVIVNSIRAIRHQAR